MYLEPKNRMFKDREGPMRSGVEWSGLRVSQRDATAIHKGVLVALVLLALTPMRSQAAISLMADKAGPRSLTYNGVQYLGQGQWCYVRKLAFRRGNLTKPAQPGVGALTVRSASNKVSLSRKFAWGTVGCAYWVEGDRVRVDVTISNASPATIGEVEVQLINLASANGSVTRMLGSEANLSGPEVAFIPYQAAKVSVANEQVAKPLKMQISRIPGGLGVFLDSSVDRVLPPISPGSMQRRAPIVRLISPGGSDTYSLSLRFADKAAAPASVLGDPFGRWVARFPANFSWPDRRPIGQFVLANYGRMLPFNPNNPRYWRFVNPKLDVDSPEGRKDFKTRLLQFADRNVATLKAINAQGVIVWDVEGEEFNSLQYVGDPHYLPPEMEGVVDEFFKRFTNAGLRCGVTLATRKLIPSPDDPPFQITKRTKRRYIDDPNELFDFLDRNISFAKKRWGCTLFYIDANGNLFWPTSAVVFRRLAAKHPDVLLIPEQKTLIYYASTAPYCQDNLGRETCPASEARWLYPKAFSVTKITGEPVSKGFSAMNVVSRVRDGDVVLVPSWSGLQHRYVQVPEKVLQRAFGTKAPYGK
jgi:hypothetical protein